MNHQQPLKPPGVPYHGHVIGPTLEPEQQQLFEELVEASRSVERSKRQPFMFIPLGQHDQVQGNGFLQVVLGEDILVLQDAGLITVSNYHSSGNGFNFYIPPEGYSYYEEVKQSSIAPVDQVEEDIGRYLANDEFRRRHPQAYARWSEASNLLWGAESEQELSTIGHKCREAIQEFVTDLVNVHTPAEVNPDKSKTRDRLSAVIETKRSEIGSTRSQLLDALFDYWRAVGNLIQRQEHEGIREKEALVWEDGRRVVFQTAVAMFEIDRGL